MSQVQKHYQMVKAMAVWCLLLAFPRLDIDLDSSITCLLYNNLRVVLVDNSITLLISHLPCVCGT